MAIANPVCRSLMTLLLPCLPLQRRQGFSTSAQWCCRQMLTAPASSNAASATCWQDQKEAELSRLERPDMMTLSWPRADIVYRCFSKVTDAGSEEPFGSPVNWSASYQKMGSRRDAKILLLRNPSSSDKCRRFVPKTCIITSPGVGEFKTFTGCETLSLMMLIPSCSLGF
jgi:hypothetical protein